MKVSAWKRWAWILTRLRAFIRALWFPSYTVRIPEATLQRLLESRFPLEKTRYGCTLAVRDPVVRLQAGDGTVGLEVTLQATLPGGFRPAWRGWITLRLDYQRDQGAFYLRDPRLQSPDFPGMLAGYAKPVLTLIGLALDPVLAATPVYTFDLADYRHRWARMFLKSVTVRDGQLLLELGRDGKRDLTS
ncbi:MAG: DUF1439 domain-containing protein [Gammaproteobacteria bacterium]|nr:DUF1439 domain-containing protein [Gammaproteobacteria bacterium]